MLKETLKLFKWALRLYSKYFFRYCPYPVCLEGKHVPCYGSHILFQSLVFVKWIRGLVSKETVVLCLWRVETKFNVWFISRVDNEKKIGHRKEIQLASVGAPITTWLNDRLVTKETFI